MPAFRIKRRFQGNAGTGAAQNIPVQLPQGLLHSGERRQPRKADKPGRPLAEEMKQILIVASAALSDRHNSLLHSAGIHFPDQILHGKGMGAGRYFRPETCGTL